MGQASREGKKKSKKARAMNSLTALPQAGEQPAPLDAEAQLRASKENPALRASGAKSIASSKKSRGSKGDADGEMNINDDYAAQIAADLALRGGNEDL